MDKKYAGYPSILNEAIISKLDSFIDGGSNTDLFSVLGTVLLDEFQYNNQVYLTGTYALVGEQPRSPSSP